MSNDRSDDPFATPEPQGPPPGQWQGTPVPPAPGQVPLPPSTGYAQAPPPPGAYVSPTPPTPPAVAAPPQYAPAPQQGVAYPPPPPAGYSQTPAYGASNTAKDWMGITSLILSLLTPLLVVTAIPGVIFGHLGLGAAKRGEASNRGIALAGTIVGWVMIGLGVLFIGFVALVIAADSSTQY